MSEDSIVGRTEELAIIRKVAGRVGSSKFGGLTLVKGIAGVGKTRLMEELASDAVKNDVASVWAHCSNDDGVPALWPWVQVLRKLVTDAELIRLTNSQPSSIQRLANHFPEFINWGVGLSVHGSVDPYTEKFLLLDSIRTIIIDIGKSHPLLIIMEDLQWADDSSISVLEMILESPGPEGVELVVTVRDDVLAAHRYIPSRTITGSVNFASVVLNDLNQSDSETLFADLVGESVAEDSLADVWAITHGNPLFIREYASSWVRGIAFGDGYVPSSAIETIESRLSVVSVEKLAVIEYGAVLGNEFDFARLAAVMKTPDRHDLAVKIGNGIELGLIEERPESPGWFKFTHEVIRRVIYDRIPNSHRATIHREIAETLENLPGESTTGHAAEISAHWQRAGVAGDLERSAHWALRAGREALDSFSFNNAHDHFEHARQAAHQIGAKNVEAEANAGVGESLAPLGREEEAIKYLTLAFDQFLESGLVDRAVQIGQVNFTGTYGQLAMVPIYERCLDLIEADSLVGARIQSHLARVVAIEMGDFKRGRALLKSASRIARKSRDHHLESIAAGYGVQIAAFAAEWSECIAYCERVFELQSDVDDPYSVSIAGMLLAGFRVGEGRHKESDALMARSRRSAERSGNKLRIVSCDLLELRIAHSRCEWDRVDRVISNTSPEYPSADRVVAMSALCHHLVGNTTAGDAALERFLILPPETPESPDAQYFPFLARSTKNSEHIAIVKDAAVIAEKSRAEYIRRRGVVAKGWMAVEEDDIETGKDAMEDLQSAELLQDEISLLPALEFLCGDIDKAATDFEELIESLHIKGILFYEAWARFDFARLLATHQEVRPDIQPKNYVSEARALALKLGLIPLVARLDELLDSLGIVRTPFDLTRREIDVLTLVAHGSTNKEIADSLFVSPHTVNRHLGNLFTKLGVSNRAAATDLAHQRNLV
ncbi:MAG: AAA family ATPase [Chloroflexi bacterium]|nr:AAA family ATPase [Chloroflexota bacterium]